MSKSYFIPLRGISYCDPHLRDLLRQEGILPEELIYKPVEAFHDKNLSPRLVKLRRTAIDILGEVLGWLLRTSVGHLCWMKHMGPIWLCPFKQKEALTMS